ncbi:hypothetical protein EDEG_02659 [Edhazardia aedis USNM 41457]|uniref:DNA polymerase alpha subunit B OB domain-containing protein n=1 Tax=Edhazardia aedis (strain USNM 41457) TaxID=1003232 RepID=J8ZTE1_EDHAE|nr:hypothetical protein EDEG_02659 [Edhazardia aedis USNM 41457]|eukprot:EJW02953.1 hypothetical protein EDEG_02659 [Edhazardia aedis USNM 41457]
MNIEETIFKKLNKPKISDRVEIRNLVGTKNKNLFFVKQNEKYAYIKHRLESMRPYYLEILDLAEFKPINTISEKSFYTFGIITSIGEQKLAPNKVFITSNVDSSNDVLIRLDLQYLKRYSVFPGEIVAIYGKNIQGNEIIVEQIWSMSQLSFNSVDRNTVEKYNRMYTKETFRINMISGPFSDDGHYTILEKFFIKYMRCLFDSRACF